MAAHSAPAPAATPAASSAASDWERVTQLDAGPKGPFKSQEEARAGSLAHLGRQEKTLRKFIGDYPGDEHAFEARLRLSRVLQIRSGLQNFPPAQAEAKRILDELEGAATGAQRVEVDFARLAMMMRTMRGAEPQQREDLLIGAQRFQSAHPDDRRVPALLAEVATLFDREPDTKRNLLVQAQKTCTDPGLAKRLADDLKRLDFLGKPVPLHLTGTKGQTDDLAQFHGKIVVLIFFADFSPPSMEAVAAVRRASRDWPKEAVQVVGVSLDKSSAELAATISKENIAWPVVFDAKGWNGAAPRTLGINTLPTVWLIDREGVLRSLDGLHGMNEQMREMLAK